MSPVIALTPGEPAGIGPDLLIQWSRTADPYAVVAVADPGLLQQRAQQLGIPVRITAYRPGHTEPQPGTLAVLPVSLRTEAPAGELRTANAPYVTECLQRACAGCMNGEFAAMVTGPVHKRILNQAGIAFSGHTEFLGRITGGHPVMLLAADGVRVALATTHLPLAQVPAAITAAGLSTTLRVLHDDLGRRFGVRHPRIAVCGLNPHAGEGGYLGAEELEIIEPTMQALLKEGLRLVGPVPADTAFTPEALQEVDAVLAMYHDQGLPVIKHLGFGRVVNVTLGLPIIRTSVDHGTALALAGTGRGHATSLRAAIALAAQLAAR